MNKACRKLSSDSEIHLEHKKLPSLLTFSPKIFACFLNYEKAFTVQHFKLIEVLEKVWINDKDIEFIRNLYWVDSAMVKMGDGETEDINIQSGVKEGCLLSPLIFH